MANRLQNVNGNAMRKRIYIPIVILLACFKSLCYSQTNTEPCDTIVNKFHCIPEPSFPGGGDSLLAFIRQNLKWPITDGCDQGTIYVTFTIDTLGVIKDPIILKGICQPYDNEALRIVSIMPKWNPAIEIINCKRQPVETKFNLPFKFPLD